MNKIAILGSYVSRDAFEMHAAHEYEITAFFAHTSFATLNSVAQVDEDPIHKIKSPFQRKMIQRDMEKSVLRDLQATEFDTLIIDFIDERFDLQRFPSGHLRTLSSEYVNIAAAPPEGSIIRADSDEKLELWKQGWNTLCDMLRRTGALGKTFINRVFWSKTLVDGQALYNDYIDHIQLMNGILQEMYDYIAATTPEIRWIVYPTAAFKADPDHKWGVAPFHYQTPVYEHMLASLPAPLASGTKISLIVPCYNAIGKIGRCLSSLHKIDLPTSDYEVVFVDDCSTDGTFEMLQAQCADTEHWRVLQLMSNSGSPSAPRNRGIAEARGDYVFFLDCDDEVLPDTLRVYLTHAEQTGADIIRGNLIAEIGRRRRVVNKIEGWSSATTKAERIRLIIGRQSTTVCSMIRTETLRRHRVSWRSDLCMGEDTVFLIDALTAANRIEYIDHPTFVYVKTPSFSPSSTQSYGNRELRDHLMVWRRAVAALAPFGIDYVTLRLQVGLQAALRSMIFINRGDISDDTFHSLVSFLTEHDAEIKKFGLSSRLKGIVTAAKSGDPQAFWVACRPRLLIAGYDLKFMTTIVPDLEQTYDVRVDEWKGHDNHDEKASRAALEWAELIWCEWLLGNAVWYSHNKKPHQRLIIRMHRFELGRDFGERIDIDKVDSVVAVSTLFLERLLERFPNIPRHKARLQHNYINTSSYKKSGNPDRRFHLGMIGILPMRKGFAEALSILQDLRRQDPRYTLDVFGKTAQDVPWLAKIPEEHAYFEHCTAMIEKVGLGDAVRFRGHVDMHQDLANHHIGITLSLSESVRDFPCFESFHLAIADGFAAGGLGLVRYWEGAEFVWPERITLPSNTAIVERILSYRDDPESYYLDCEMGSKFVGERYNTDRFLASFRTYFRESS